MHKLPHPDYDTWLDNDQLDKQIPVNPGRQARLKRLIQFWETKADGLLANLLLYRQEVAEMERNYADSLFYLELAVWELKKQAPGLAGNGESAPEGAVPS